MESIKKITGRFKVVQSTSDTLIGYYIENDVYVGQDVKLCKDNECKYLSVDMIVRVDYDKYHILNSNVGIIAKKI